VVDVPQSVHSQRVSSQHASLSPQPRPPITSPCLSPLATGPKKKEMVKIPAHPPCGPRLVPSQSWDATCDFTLSVTHPQPSMAAQPHPAGCISIIRTTHVLFIRDGLASCSDKCGPRGCFKLVWDILCRPLQPRVVVACRGDDSTPPPPTSPRLTRVERRDAQPPVSALSHQSPDL
jgi:hypothetical protein